MDRSAFITKLADALELPAGALTEQSALQAETWDSLALISAIALIDEELGVTVGAPDLKECGTVAALLTMLEQRQQAGTG